MKIRAMGSLVLACSLALAAHTAMGKATLGPRLKDAIDRSTASTIHHVWVYLADKGGKDVRKAVPGSIVTEASLRRRMNVLPTAALVDETDLPVNAEYVHELGQTGVAIQQVSKWLNAVSIHGTDEQITRCAALPFVKNIELVGHYRRSPVPPPAEEVIPALPKTTGTHTLDYGTGLSQVALMNVPALHDLGNSAQGVIVGVFDNGFRLPGHEVFASMNIIAQYDFVDNKVSVVPSNPSTSFGDHGIYTLSTIGGYKPGRMIGPAYGASYILARTENDSSETPAEEDKWVRAIEWADSLGVQVTSTSLGYLDFDPGYTSWTWENMDGRTTVISRTAAMAVRKGILVVNSAGNEGYNATHNTLVAPADADSVVAAGAVGPDGKRVSFSSVGPSTSVPPHIKPDLMAQGSSVYVASSTTTAGYIFIQGTSFSCPLTAGVAALLVKEHPTAAPMTIVNAMKQTASQAATPDNLMGWGVLNALAAHNSLNSTGTNDQVQPGAGYALDQNRPNPFPNAFNPSTHISYVIPQESELTIAVYDLIGREVATLVRGHVQRGVYQVTWDGTDGRGEAVASGMYIYRLVAAGVDGNQSVISNKMLLVR
jgi:serine protease AprX